MGSFGTGNFDDDDALDVRNDFIQQIVTSICENLDYQSFDVSDCDRVVAHVVVLSAILQETRCSEPTSEDGELTSLLKGMGSGVGLSKQLIRGWKEEVLKVFDAGIDGLQPAPSYKSGRRKAMEHAFSVLESLGDSKDA